MLSIYQEKVTLFDIQIENIINKNHPLCILSRVINWDNLTRGLAKYFSISNGRPSKNIRLIMGLTYLKYIYNMSDQQLLDFWVENYYWQYFCGFKVIQYKYPVSLSTLSGWRKMISTEDFNSLLHETIIVAEKFGYLTKEDIEVVNIDTTVQNKNISFPTDASLFYKAIQKFGKMCSSLNIKPKHSFKRVSKREFILQGRARKAHNTKEADEFVNKLRDYLIKLLNEIRRIGTPEFLSNPKVINFFEIANKLIEQSKDSKNKIYSLHEFVSCMSKGKAHKLYEFGNKVAIVTTSLKCYILAVFSFSNNPYDGNTLAACLELAEDMVKQIGKILFAFVDQGYRKYDYLGKISINIVKKGWKKLEGFVKKYSSRRSAIEPVISHLKSDHRLLRNYLKGIKGDEINIIFSACGYNLKKVLNNIKKDIKNSVLKKKYKFAS